MSAQLDTAWSQPRCCPSQIFLPHVPSTSLFPGARGALALRPTHHSWLSPYQSYTAHHDRGCAECIPPYVTSDSLAYVMHARVRLLAMRPHVTRHGLPQVRGVFCLCHLALPMYPCRRLNLPRSHLARLNLACITPGSARCYADRPSPLSPHLLNRRGAQSAAICAPSAPLPTDLTRHAALQRRRRRSAAERTKLGKRRKHLKCCCHSPHSLRSPPLLVCDSFGGWPANWPAG